MLLTRLNIGLFPLGVASILLANGLRHREAPPQNIINFICAFIILSISTDFAAACLKDGVIPSSDEALAAVHTLYCLINCAILIAWHLYICVSVYGADAIYSRKRAVTWTFLPLTALVAAVLSTPFTGIMFRAEGGEIIRSGAGILIIGVLAGFPAMWDIIKCVLESSRASSLERRWQLLLFAGFSLFPAAEFAIFIAGDGQWMTWTTLCVGLMILYIRAQSGMITTDPLTGLNNRGEFDKYLEMRVRRNGEGSGFCLFIIDIDDFKYINDKFGHTAGDEALRRMADALRETFDYSNAFFARIGGDEFAMIIDADAPPEETIRMLEGALAKSDARYGTGYGIKASVGSAVFDGVKSATELFDEADKAMYGEKKHRRGEI
ncbi:MAG: GGDEF domain-containing protein [Clostridia bacterium]|nr:GGDEF domain-containing protein [Clostridia bacterium]